MIQTFRNPYGNYPQLRSFPAYSYFAFIGAFRDGQTVDDNSDLATTNIQGCLLAVAVHDGHLTVTRKRLEQDGVVDVILTQEGRNVILAQEEWGNLRNQSISALIRAANIREELFERHIRHKILPAIKAHWKKRKDWYIGLIAAALFFAIGLLFGH